MPATATSMLPACSTMSVLAPLVSADDDSESVAVPVLLGRVVVPVAVLSAAVPVLVAAFSVGVAAAVVVVEGNWLA